MFFARSAFHSIRSACKGNPLTKYGGEVRKVSALEGGVLCVSAAGLPQKAFADEKGMETALDFTLPR